MVSREIQKCQGRQQAAARRVVPERDEVPPEEGAGRGLGIVGMLWAWDTHGQQVGTHKEAAAFDWPPRAWCSVCMLLDVVLDEQLSSED